MKTKIATAALLIAGLTVGAKAEVHSTTSWSITIGNERPAPREVVVVRHEPPPRVVYVERGPSCHGRGHGHAYGHRHGYDREVVYVEPAPRCERRTYFTVLPRHDEGGERIGERRDDRGGQRYGEGRDDRRGDRDDDRVAMDDEHGRGRNR